MRIRVSTIRQVSGLLLFASLLTVAVSCLQQKGEKEKVARSYCSRCHLFPEPGLLNKETWIQNILPQMGSLAGIKYYSGHPYIDVYALQRRRDSLNPVNPSIVLEDWNKIVDYYNKEAPDSMPGQGRAPITIFTNLFSPHEVFSASNRVPSTSYVRIDPGNKWIYAADAYDSSLLIYNDRLELEHTLKMNGIIPDMFFSNPLVKGGGRGGIVTNIGIMNPNDFTTGSVDSFSISAGGKLLFLKKKFGDMPRPVQTLAADLDQDGHNDYLVCGFGNTTGGLYWMKSKDSGAWQKNCLRPLPGAIKSIVKDFNHDGRPDIMTLMAQAREGIYLFTNKGGGIFQTTPLLLFPPIYGSTYFELDDFNKDGKPDILYTCGDNADFSSNVLKPYHGIYIFLNQGNNHYEQKYFFPLHGCYKAIARDFDMDGDLDIFAISYYPDKKNQPQESAVYLENKGDFRFKPFGIRQYAHGRWLTLDAGDVDGDGDPDIILGGLVPPADAWRRNLVGDSATLLLLQNNTVHASIAASK